MAIDSLEKNTALSRANVYFRAHKIRSFIGLALVLALTIAASSIAGFDLIAGIESFPKAFGWMANNFVPNQDSLSNAPRIMQKLLETVFVAIVSTVIGAVIALALALLGARSTGGNAVISALIRTFASVLRNIPIVAWAIIFLFSFGASTFTGFLALALGSIGLLTRAFMESIDETSQSTVEALKASGASRVQIIFQAVLPSVLPQIVSWVLYMIETNIRDATLVGLLTNSGIGFAFSIYYKSMQYTSAGLTVLSIVIVIVLLELVSNKLRRLIL